MNHGLQQVGSRIRLRVTRYLFAEFTELLSRVPYGQNLYPIRMDLIENAVPKADEFANRELVPLGYHATLCGEPGKRFETLLKTVEPSQSPGRSILRDEVDDLASTLRRLSRPKRPSTRDSRSQVSHDRLVPWLSP